MPRRLDDQSGGSDDRRDAPEANRTLDSWKEIGDFLGVSVRTAHRWEESAGMPVHRAPSGHICAHTTELNRWRRSSPKRPWRRWRLPAALMLGGIAIVASLFPLWRPHGVEVPATVRFEGEKVLVLDQNGRTRWTASIPHQSFGEGSGWDVSTPDRFLVADVDQDGAVEVLIYALVKNSTDGQERVICYSQDGRVRWEFVLGRHFKDGYGEYAQHYWGHFLRVVRIGGRSYVLSIAAHRRWHPCQVALLDPSTGKIVEEFWHPGAITHALLVDLDHDGADELVLAGVNNPGSGPGSPVLLVLRLPFSLARPTSGSVMAGMSNGGPISYVIFPRPDMLAAQGGLAMIQGLDFEEPATLLVHARYMRDRSTVLSYTFDGNLRLRNFFAPLDLAAAHNTLWRAGVLTHPFSDQEEAWLQGVRSFTHVPDGNAAHVPPFHPGS